MTEDMYPMQPNANTGTANARATRRRDGLLSLRPGSGCVL